MLILLLFREYASLFWICPFTWSRWRAHISVGFPSSSHASRVPIGHSFAVTSVIPRVISVFETWYINSMYDMRPYLGVIRETSWLILQNPQELLCCLALFLSDHRNGGAGIGFPVSVNKDLPLPSLLCRQISKYFTSRISIKGFLFPWKFILKSCERWACKYSVILFYSFQLKYIMLLCMHLNIWFCVWTDFIIK